MSERQAIYDQDCEFIRYQDTLRWSRFKTASVVEAGLLYGVYQFAFGSRWEKEALVTAAVALVGLVLGIAVRDANLAKAHLDRIISFEKIEPFRPPEGVTGLTLMKLAILIIWLVNLGLVLKVWFS